MFNLKTDQAAGLRRLMAQNSGRIISLISVETNRQASTLWAEHLAAILQSQDSKVLLIQAYNDWQGIKKPTLLDVIKNKARLDQAVHYRYGFDMLYLTQNGQLTHALSSNLKQQLEAIVMQLTQDYDLILVNTCSVEMEKMAWDLLYTHEMVIQMTQDEQAIQAAYACIKRICLEYGRRPIGIVMTQAQEKRAKQIFNSLNQVSQQFISTSLTLLGTIPEDQSIKKAQHLGRSVTDVFPLAPTSAALRNLAQRLNNSSISHLELAAV